MENHKKCIVIIGAEGFLGRHVGELFYTKGYDVIGIDIKEPSNSIKYKYYVHKNIGDINGNDISFINTLSSYILLNVGGVSRNGVAYNEPIVSVHNTVTAYLHLLELLDTCPPSYLMNISTREVNILQNNKEKLFGKQKLYSTYKYATELISEGYSEQWDIPLRIFRLSDIFGIGDHSSKVLHIFLKKAILNEDIIVNNSATQLFLTEVTEVSKTIYDTSVEMRNSISLNFVLIYLWDENYHFTLNELAHLAKEINKTSESKIINKQDNSLPYNVKSKIKNDHLKVLNELNEGIKLNIIN